MTVLTAACGGGASASLAAPGGVGTTGSSITGLVIGGSTSTTAGSWSTLADRGMTVTISGTNRSSSVDSGGQFTLTDVPPGPVTLTFSGQGVNATATISNVAPNEDVKITVKVSGSSAHIESEEHHGHDGGEGELSGVLSDLNTGARTFKVGTQLVHAATTATIRHGDRTVAFTDLKNGNEVEVRGTVSGTTLEATEVKVEDGTGGAGDTETD